MSSAIRYDSSHVLNLFVGVLGGVLQSYALGLNASDEAESIDVDSEPISLRWSTLSRLTNLARILPQNLHYLLAGFMADRLPVCAFLGPSCRL